MNRHTHTPLRVCMGCGSRAPQATLLRVAIRPGDGQLMLRDARQPGRSGYLHRARACWDRFTARKGALRSLRCSVDKVARVAFVAQLQRAEPSAMMR